MKVVKPKQQKFNRVRVQVQRLTDQGQPVGGKGGYEKNLIICLHDTTVQQVYDICLEALSERSE